ncbi:MAG TPA: MFS transporter [Ktedonobacteraceae bacterium]|nr:MFS transporter [Ktedonobacteraceae bacterium]
MEHSPANLQQAATGRRLLLTRGTAFWLVAYMLGVTIMGNNIPAPLYPVYQSLWHFSTAMITVIFAVVALGVFPSLLFLGPLSDQRGRRPVLLLGVILATLATLVFIFAQGVIWLIVARLLQGIAFGALSGTAAATLAELEPGGNARRAALAATLTIVLSQATAPLLSGLLAQYAPWPTVLVFLILLVLLLPAVAGMWALPETVAVQAGKMQLRPRFAIPASIRRQFTLASVAVFSAFGVVGLISSLGPSFASTILHAQNRAIGGLVIFALLGPSALAQLLCRNWPLRRLLVWGPILLAIGLALILFALPTHTLVVFILGTACAGLGQGLTYLGSQEFVGSVATDDERGEVFSAFNVVVYFGASLVALGVGFGSGLIGLYPATVVVVAVIGILALGASLTSARTRMLAHSSSV